MASWISRYTIGAQRASRSLKSLRTLLSNGEICRGQQQVQSRAFAVPSLKTGTDVRILEVGPRDGLQNIKQTISTATKIELIDRLADTGLTAIEATSFVSPKWIPQLADSADVFNAITPLARQRSLDVPVLAPNMKGLERALQCGAKEVVVFASASEGFSMKNQNCTIAEALARQREVARGALEHGLVVRGVISCIFSCPYDGPTPPASVVKIAREFLDMGCYEVGLGDTLGVGTPTDTESLVSTLVSEGIPVSKLAGHFHDTYGQAVANVVKAYDLGIRTFDSAVAGLGGCPYAKGAKGNLASEDIIYTFEKSGVRTGVDLDRLVRVGDWISKQLGQPNGSRAGSALFAKQASVVEPTHPGAQSAASHQPAAGTQQSSSPSRTWRETQQTGEYSVSRAGNVVKVTLTRPRNGNAMTASMVEGLTRLYKELAQDRSVFTIVLTAEGKYFCTGMDLKSTDSSDPSAKSSDFGKIVSFFKAIQDSPQTTIAQIQGPCFAGGVGLAFSSDIRLVSPQARFTLTEVKLGLAPSIISRFILREWGVPFTREAMLSGRAVKAEELKLIGAVHGIASSEDSQGLDNLVEEYLDGLTTSAPRAAGFVKELVELHGAEGQERRIEEIFAEMMKLGSEGRHGIEQFGKKVKSVDWGQFWAEKAKL